MGSLLTHFRPKGDRVLFYDSFTDADGTLLPDHTPDVDTVGTGWVVNQGTWSIQSNRARKTASVATHQSCMVDCGATDYVARARWNAASEASQRRGGLSVRQAGAASASGYVAYLDNNGGGYLTLLEFDGAGGATARGATGSSGNTLTNNGFVQAEVAGSTITATHEAAVGGLLSVTYASATRNASSTHVGLHAFDLQSFDDFEVTA